MSILPHFQNLATRGAKQWKMIDKKRKHLSPYFGFSSLFICLIYRNRCFYVKQQENRQDERRCQNEKTFPVKKFSKTFPIFQSLTIKLTITIIWDAFRGESCRFVQRKAKYPLLGKVTRGIFLTDGL